MARTRSFDLEPAVAAATEVFRREGYAGASMRDLSEATGLGSGSIYAAFGSKDGLYLAALDQYRQRYAHALIDQLNAQPDPVTAIRSAVAGALDVMVDDARSRGCLIVGAAMERAHTTPDIAAHLHATTELLQTALARTLADAQQRRLIVAPESPDDLAHFLVTTLQGLRVMAAIDPDPETLRRTADIALERVLATRDESGLEQAPASVGGSADDGR
jgi:TetR/AcrR family transcriptional repressor of nem operon